MTNLNKLQEVVIKSKKAHDPSIDVAKMEKELLEKQEKELLEKQTKADEVYHTTNTGYGEELIPTNVLMDPIINMIYKTNSLISKLP